MTCEILEGDCRSTLKTLPDASVHCCITSPPYFGLRDFGCAAQIGLESTLAEYLDTLSTLFGEVRRVLRRDATLWVNCGDAYAAGGNGGHQASATFHGHAPRDGDRAGQRKTAPPGFRPKDLLGLPWRLAFRLQEDGYYLRQAITWCKPSPFPESVTDRCTSATEMLFMFTRSPRYFYDATAISEPCVSDHGSGNGFKRDGRLSFMDEDGPRGNDQPWTPPVTGTRNRRNWWVINSEAYPGPHYAVFPRALVEPCILAGTSAYGCCAQCGAPWRRVVEKSGGTIGKGWHGHSQDAVRGQRKPHSAALARTYRREEKGWQPTCSHEALVEPCTVLDPFAGTGTVAVVALPLGRRAVLCELSPSYVKQIKRRLSGVQLPLPGVLLT